jgi:hypothetical protein
MRVEFQRRAPFGFTLPNFHGVAMEPCAESLRRLGYVLTVPFSDQTGLIEIQGMESLPPFPLKNSSTRNTGEYIGMGLADV